MAQFIVAFSTTGNSPKDGHRFNEIILVGQENGVPNGLRAKFRLNVKPASSQQVTFPEALAAMKTLIGDSELIVHNKGNWHRFIRAELRNIKKHGANHLIRNVIDVSAWAHQRFPRQRKDVFAIAKRAGIEIPADLSGLNLEVELLRRIANLMSIPITTAPVASEAIAVSPIADMQEVSQATKRNWIEMFWNLWRKLGMHA